MSNLHSHPFVIKFFSSAKTFIRNNDVTVVILINILRKYFVWDFIITISFGHPSLISIFTLTVIPVICIKRYFKLNVDASIYIPSDQ